MTRVVIDIPEKDYNRVCEMVKTDKRYSENTTIGTVYSSVAQGTVLTKEHGDLISRSELKRAFDKWWSCDDIPATVAEDLIDDAPTVSERPQGKWIRVIDYSDEYEKRWHYECSECKNAPYYCGEIYKLHFCPNCGADMRKGERK